MKKYIFLLIFTPLSIFAQNVMNMAKVPVKDFPNSRIIVTKGAQNSGYTTPNDLKEFAKDTQTLSFSNDVLTLDKGGNSVVLPYEKRANVDSAKTNLRAEMSSNINYVGLRLDDTAGVFRNRLRDTAAVLRSIFAGFDSVFNYRVYLGGATFGGDGLVFSSLSSTRAQDVAMVIKGHRKQIFFGDNSTGFDVNPANSALNVAVGEYGWDDDVASVHGKSGIVLSTRQYSLGNANETGWKISQNGNLSNYNTTGDPLVITGIRTFASDAAADADATLLSGSFYKLTGSRQLYQKP